VLTWLRGSCSGAMGAGMAVIALGSALRVGQGKKRHVFTPPAQTQLPGCNYDTRDQFFPLLQKSPHHRSYRSTSMAQLAVKRVLSY